MNCQNDHMTTMTVLPGADVRAQLPQSGALRFERKSGAMAGTPAMAIEGGALVMHYADGASITIEGI